MPKVIKKFDEKMEKPPKLNFPNIKLRATIQNGHTMVFDTVRNIYVVLTPEEWVRRHLVEYLIKGCAVPLRSIIEEYPVELNTMAQRADIVVMGSNTQPLILAECKAPDVPIGPDTFSQASRYNAVVGAQYIIITNGLKHYCFEKSDQGYEQLNYFPQFK